MSASLHRFAMSCVRLLPAFYLLLQVADPQLLGSIVQDGRESSSCESVKHVPRGPSSKSAQDTQTPSQHAETLSAFLETTAAASSAVSTLYEEGAEGTSAA